MVSACRLLGTCPCLASVKFISLISTLRGSVQMILRSEVVTHVPRRRCQSIRPAIELSYPRSLITEPIAPPLPLSVEGAAAQVNTLDFSTVEKDFDICVIRV